MVLADEGGDGLAEGGGAIVGEIFKIQRDGAAGNGGGAKGVDRRLHKQIGKAKHGALYGRGNAGF